MRDVTLSQLERFGAAANEADEIFQMDEDAFRLFYERTARPVWAYLARISGDPRLADDLLQEAYYRLLRTKTTYESDAHRRNYLFRIATNLVHDVRRRPRVKSIELSETLEANRQADPAESAAQRVDLSRAMACLKPRERELLWLAYAQGSSHDEIADVLHLRKSSIKSLLFRAKQRLAAILRERDS